MDGNNCVDDFDDFFDTPGRSVTESTDKNTNNSNNRVKSSVSRSTGKNERNGSRSDRSSVSDRDDDRYNYSSDSVTDSDGSDSQSSKKRKNSKRVSRSASSRSDGSYSSDSYSSDDSRSRRSSRKKERNSQSSSSDRSRTPDSPVRKRKGKRRNSYSSITSSSTYSGGKDERSLTPRQKDPPRRTAWDTDSKPNNTRPDRPKTAKRRSLDHRNSGDDGPVKEKLTQDDSDSDMTDVSPIMSPRNGSVGVHKKGSGQPAVYQAMPLEECSREQPPMYQAMPRGSSGRHLLDGGDNQALDLNILMKAVSELEKEKRVKSNTRRVMFEPLRARPSDRSNYTFSNNDTHRIEQENKRLLEKIMRQMRKDKDREPRPAEIKIKQSTLTPSAVNRRREQSRIESENLAFLRRLQKIKPTRGISRNEQLTAYNSTVLHGIPIATLHPSGKSGTRSGRTSSASSLAGSLGRTRSLTSIHSAATASSFGTSASASRQSSRAGSRPGSAKKSNRVERPPWNDRW